MNLFITDFHMRLFHVVNIVCVLKLPVRRGANQTLHLRSWTA